MSNEAAERLHAGMFQHEHDDWADGDCSRCIREAEWWIADEWRRLGGKEDD